MTNAEKLAKNTEVMIDVIFGAISPCYACIYKNVVDGCNSHKCRESVKKWLKSEAKENGTEVTELRAGADLHGNAWDG